MRRYLGLAVATALAIVAAAPGPAAAVADGPEPGFTGGFGEPTCTACHFDSPAEPEEGALVIEGLPERYEPGREYPLRVTLRDARLERGGFQLAVRYADGESEGRQAGLLAVESLDAERAEVVEHGEPPVLYARQTLAGARSVDSRETSWVIRWTAPPEVDGTGGPVVVHAAANAANDDESALGDVIHQASARSGPPGP